MILDIANFKNINIKYTLTGHTDYVLSLVSLKNGHWASSSNDKTIKIWDLTLGKLKYTFDESNDGHLSGIDYLALLNNGYLASCSSVFGVSGVIKVWDISNQKLKYTFNSTNGGHNGSIFDLIALKNGYLASASEDKTVKIWDVTEGKIKTTFDSKNGGHLSIVWSLLSINTNLMASGAGDIYDSEKGELKIWNLKNNKLEYTYDKSNGGHSNRIYSFVLLENGEFATGSVDKTIKIWSPTNASKNTAIDYWIGCYFALFIMMSQLVIPNILLL